MSEEKKENKNLENTLLNKDESSKRNPKNQLFFLKVVALFTLIFLSIFLYLYWQDLSKRRLLARVDNEKFSNLDSDIFDLSQDFNNQNIDENHDLSDLNIASLKEKSSGFIYQLLIKNQLQIEDLRKQNRELRSEFLKYKTYERYNKIVIYYASFRDKLFNEKNFNTELQNLEIICNSDEMLHAKITNLKSHLVNFYPKNKLEISFKNLIPEIKAISDSAPQDNSWLKKINEKIAKIIIIRRTLINNSGDVDDKIITIENHLKAENYQEALGIILSLNQSYNEVFKNFLENLNASLEVQKIDLEILNYLKSLN
jgi:hypothetical protein